MSVDPREVRIEPLSPRHLQGLLAFYRSLSEEVTRFYRPFHPIDARTIGAHLDAVAEDQAWSWAVRDAQGAIVGHGFITGILSTPVLGIGLHQDYLSQGIGRRLMEWMLRAADAAGLPKVTLTVVKTNTRARRLYESVGFVAMGETSFRAPGDSLYMERHLPPA